MRVMQLTVDCPWPTVSGADIRNAIVAAAPGVAEFLAVGLARPSSGDGASSAAYRQLSGFGGRNPWRCVDPAVPTCLRFPESALSAVDALVAEFRPDAVIAEGVVWRDAIERLQDCGVPTVIDMHNLESRLFAERLATQPWWRRLAAMRSTAAISACVRADRSLSGLTDRTWVCSEDDATALRAIGGRADDVIRNPIPDESLLGLPLDIDRYRNTAPLFIGHLGYFPNVAAVAELAGPFVAATARLGLRVRPTVAGRSPRGFIERLARTGRVSLVANPPSTAELARGHGFAVLPIRQGSGTRIKAIEALAAGLVVIATPKAVEGLGLVHGQHGLLAETPEEMAEGLVRLTEAPHEAVALAACGRQFAAEHHGRRAVLASVASALRAVGRPEGRDCRPGIPSGPAGGTTGTMPHRT